MDAPALVKLQTFKCAETNIICKNVAMTRLRESCANTIPEEKSNRKI